MTMTWFGIVLVSAIIVSTLLAILGIDEPRQPITTGLALWITVINALVIWGIVAVGTTT